MRRPPAGVLGDAADGAAAPSGPRASGGAPPSLAGAKKSLGGTGSPPKLVAQPPPPTQSATTTPATTSPLPPVPAPYQLRLPRVRQSDGTMAGTTNLQSAGALRKSYLKQHFPGLKLKPDRESRDPWMGRFAGAFLGDNYFVDRADLDRSTRLEIDPTADRADHTNIITRTESS